MQAIAVALGAERRLVNSPTFVLIQEYEGTLPLYHCDTYRLKNVDEFLDLGIDEIFQSDGVCLIEWADRVAGVLPPRPRPHRNRTDRPDEPAVLHRSQRPEVGEDCGSRTNRN